MQSTESKFQLLPHGYLRCHYILSTYWLMLPPELLKWCSPEGRVVRISRASLPSSSYSPWLCPTLTPTFSSSLSGLTLSNKLHLHTRVSKHLAFMRMTVLFSDLTSPTSSTLTNFISTPDQKPLWWQLLGPSPPPRLHQDVCHWLKLQVLEFHPLSDFNKLASLPPHKF